MHRHKKLLIAIVVVVALLVAGAVIWFAKRDASAPAQTTTAKRGPIAALIDFVTHPFGQSNTPKPPAFDKTQYSLDDPASLWVVVNKQRSLPSGYIPANLRQPNIAVRSSGSSEMLVRDDAASALESLVATAKQDGISLMLVSGYRSYGLQEQVYGGNVSREGQASADKTSARPGHSEHQTGIAMDLGDPNGVCQLETCFGETAAGKWLAAHAHEYGFIIRYQNGKEGIVGYTYEPWHLRYVGPALATELYKSGQTMEEFFGLPAAPSY